MKYRKKMKKNTSKKIFRKTGKRVHPKNNRGNAMRGGIRL